MKYLFDLYIFILIGCYKFKKKKQISTKIFKVFESNQLFAKFHSLWLGSVSGRRPTYYTYLYHRHPLECCILWDWAGVPWRLRCTISNVRTLFSQSQANLKFPWTDSSWRMSWKSQRIWVPSPCKCSHLHHSNIFSPLEYMITRLIITVKCLVTHPWCHFSLMKSKFVFATAVGKLLNNLCYKVHLLVLLSTQRSKEPCGMMSRNDTLCLVSKYCCLWGLTNICSWFLALQTSTIWLGFPLCEHWGWSGEGVPAKFLYARGHRRAQQSTRGWYQIIMSYWSWNKVD